MLFTILFPRKVIFLGQLLILIIFKISNALKRYKEENGQKISLATLRSRIQLYDCTIIYLTNSLLSLLMDI